jgi:hypothetical protein
MDEISPAPIPAPAEQKQAAERKEALKLWHDADTKEKKAEAVKRFPLLKEIFSELNHS